MIFSPDRSNLHVKACLKAYNQHLNHCTSCGYRGPALGCEFGEMFWDEYQRAIALRDRVAFEAMKEK